MEFVRFGELYSIPSGNGLSRPSAVRGEGYRMIGMGELFAKDIISDMEMDRVQMSEREKKTFFVESGDLLFARQSLVAEGAGKCSIVKELSEPTTFESHLIRVRLNKHKCNPWYFYYLFRLPDNPIKAIVNQCAQAGIRGNELGKIKVPLPESKIQDRIGSILSTYDNLIELNNKRIKVLEQMAENLYKEWFVRFRFPGHENAEFENGIPKKWFTKTLNEWMSDNFNGGWGEEVLTSKKTKEASVIRGTDIEDVKKSNFRDVPLRYHTESDIKTKSLREGDIVLEISNGNINNIGRTLYISREILAHFDTVICASFCKTLRFTDKFVSFYIWQYIEYLQKSGLMFFYKNTGANGINNFNFKRFLQMPVSVPNDFKYLKVLISMFNDISVIREQNYNLIKQRDLLLLRLMSGKLEV